MLVEGVMMAEVKGEKDVVWVVSAEMMADEWQRGKKRGCGWK